MQEYLIHDNGGRPFKVIINSSNVEIYKESDDDKYVDLILRITECERILIGDDPICCSNRAEEQLPDDFYLGNSILLHIKNNTYIYIGMTIYQFESKDYITTYVSPIGNNDVPYPYAVGQKFTYLMEEHKYIENYLIWDPYQVFYSGVSANDFKDYHVTLLENRIGGTSNLLNIYQTVINNLQ